MIALVVHALRDPPDGPSNEPGVARRLESVDERSSIRCRACGSRLAESSAVFAPGDGPLVFANPAGLVFELRAVRTAPGVAAFGDATTEATWFPGYAWRIAACAQCFSHVGWQYLSVDPALGPAEFFGLIASEILEEP